MLILVYVLLDFQSYKKGRIAVVSVIIVVSVLGLVAAAICPFGSPVFISDC